MPAFNPENYETVDSRIHKFWEEHPTGRIKTKLVERDIIGGKTRWTVKSWIYLDKDDVRAAGTGYAFEIDGEGMANKTSALENCETSSIGRALANIGYSGAKRPSREEMRKTQPSVIANDNQQPPDGWHDRVDEVRTLDGLQKLYEDEARHWYTPEVKLAFTARKKMLEAGK